MNINGWGIAWRGIVLGVALTLGAAVPAVVAAGQSLTAAAISTGSDTYMLAVGWSNVLKKAGADVSLTPLEGGGTARLMRGVASGEWTIGFLSSPHYLSALEGKDIFEKDPPDLIAKYKTVRSLFGMTSGTGQMVVRADSGIKRMADLKGKKVAIGQPGGGGAKITPALLRAHGLEDKDYQPQFLREGPALDEMRNGRLDATVAWGGIPQANVYNFSRQIPARFLSIEKAAFQTFKQSLPHGEHFLLRTYSLDSLKKAYGAGLQQDGDVGAWTFQMQVITRADLPEATAYALIKTFWEHLADVKAVGVALADLNKDDALEDLTAPLHPGAARYYKEKGWIK
jgi:hypothetical protein